MTHTELNAICKRIFDMEEDRKELASEIAKVKKDAKDSGFDTALIAKTVRIMLLNGRKRKEALDQHELFDTYLSAVGLISGFDDTPAHDPITGEIAA